MAKFLKIYLWQIISLLFNFASIFVVTPFLSSNPALYGIYTLIVAAYLFLSYADFGFLSAGIKFAAESFAKKDLEEEIKIIGFTGFIFLMFVSIYAIGVFCISFKPEFLVKNLINIGEKNIASNLLLILSLFTPVFVLQRIVQIIFAVRLQDYVFQRVLIASNIIKITFAVIFFNSGDYPIVEYFLFSQVCTTIAVIIGFIVIKKKIGYDLNLFAKSFRFSKSLFAKTKSLAFVSIFLTICWILYYELDPFIISRLLGAKYLAIYAIGFTLMEYFRSVFGILFSPFTAKFNHFVGLKDFDGLKNFFYKLLVLGLPLTVFPVLSISISIKNFIFSWVGPQYVDSVPIAKVLVLSYLLSFISSPTGILVMAYERVKLLYFITTLLPLVYWIGVFIAYKYIGLQAFADFKVAAFFAVAVVYLIIAVKILGLNFWSFLWKLFSPAILPILIIFMLQFFISPYLPVEKGKVNLLVYFVCNAGVIMGAITIYYFSSVVFKRSVNSIITPIFAKFLKME